MDTHVSISCQDLIVWKYVNLWMHMQIVRIDVTRRNKCHSLKTRTFVFMDPRSEKPSMELNRREDLTPIFEGLSNYKPRLESIVN